LNEVNKLLDESRYKLLDMSLRNPLINYNFNRRNRLIIVDEIPNIIYNKLLNEEKLILIPVPYPEKNLKDVKDSNNEISVKEHAQTLGIAIEEEIFDVNNLSNDVVDKHIDNKIQTLHYPDKLEKIMRKKASDANLAIQEKGTNILYLAIGFLQWKQSINSEKIINSPLILIPIEIIRDKADKKTGAYLYKIKYTGEDLFSNISLQHKIAKEFNIELPSFNEEDNINDYFKKIDDICQKNRELIGVSNRFALDFFQFNKLLMYLDLNPLKWPKNRNIENHSVLLEISGGNKHSDKNINFEDIPENKTEELGLVMDADASQRDAIAQVIRGHNLIIEGPPGTGKSQTIANLIAVALSEGKSVLFVAEKLVALEVVKKRLDAVGLGNFILELHSHKSNKSNFYNSLRERVDLEVYSSTYELNKTINNISSIKQNINDYLKILHTPVNSIDKTPYNIFGEVLNREESDFQNLPSENKLLEIDSKKLYALSNELDALESYIKENNNILSSPWSGLKTTNAISLDYEIILDLLKEYSAILKTLDSLFLEDTFTKQFPKNMQILDVINNAFAQGALSEYPPFNEIKLLNKISTEKLDSLMKQVQSLLDESFFIDELDIEMINNLSSMKNLSRTLRGFKDIGFFGKIFNKSYKNSVKEFKIIFIKENLKKPEDMSEAINRYLKKIETFILNFKSFYFNGGKDIYKAIGIEEENIDNISTLNNTIINLKKVMEFEFTFQWKKKLIGLGFPEQLIKMFETKEQQDLIESLIKLSIKSKPLIKKINFVKNNLKKYVEIDETIFFNNKKEFYEQHLIIEEKLNYKSLLPVWIDISRLLSTIHNYGLSNVLIEIEKRGLISKVKSIILYLYYREWAYKIIRENSILSKFNRHLFESSLKEFKIIDKNVSKLYAKKHALELSKNHVPRGINGKVKEKTEMILIQNEIRKQKRHIPIRETLKRASKAIRALKPCFMMSPLSVAQFIDPSQEPFDLMIMDEASQILPEDSLGAIARANQVVIVGDPNQLPPTNFFASRNNEEIEETVMTTSESILDLMLRVYPNVKRLKWHYRSKHESLIAFSNHNFYDGELMIFPSPSKDSSKTGIIRRFVNNGFFVEQINKNEANQIIINICNHLALNTKESLGVVVMNKKQADYIDRLLEDKAKDDLNLRHLIDTALIEKRLFIKNLENVQGDEADVLFIGTTYGPHPETNKVYQRFGPINGEHGWRRMNVLITRAKKRIEVFTSIKSNDILPSEGNRGRTAFRNYLKYIENGTLENIQSLNTAKEPDSPFEEAVIKYIQSLGYIAKPQVGIAGFFIDIGVTIEGSLNYILGVECDGATYHSSKSARDRDRLRQDILESLGWNIYRIWSTDWFKHKKEEKNRLKKALENAKNKAIFLKQNIEDQKKKNILDKIDTKIDNKDIDVYNKLLEFRNNVIAKKYKIDSYCILNDRIIEYLSISLPTNIVEFRNSVPLYIREKIDTKQMEYIDNIFNIIEDSK